MLLQYSAFLYRAVMEIQFISPTFLRRSNETSLPAGHTSAFPMKKSRDSGTEKEVIPKLTLKTLLICIFISKEQSIMGFFSLERSYQPVFCLEVLESSRQLIHRKGQIFGHINGLFTMIMLFSAQRFRQNGYVTKEKYRC